MGEEGEVVMEREGSGTWAAASRLAVRCTVNEKEARVYEK